MFTIGFSTDSLQDILLYNIYALENYQTSISLFINLEAPLHLNFAMQYISAICNNW